MKTLFAIVMFLSFNAVAHDDPGNVSGVYFDPERSGEGMFVVHNETLGIIGWSLFTYDPDAEAENCKDIPAVFDDDGVMWRASDEVCVTVATGNDPAWYTGADPWDGSSFGIMYRSEAIEYPISYFGSIAEERAVGLYILDYVGEGMRLIVTPFEGEAPETVYRLYYFTDKLLDSQ